MKKWYAFYVLTLLSATATFAQCKVYVIRQSINGGVMGGFSVFADDKLVCNNLNNNKHIVLDLPAGTHTFTAQIDGKQLKKKAKEEEMPIEMESGKSYYVVLNYQVKGMIGNIYLLEVTENSAKRILKDSLPDSDCD